MHVETQRPRSKSPHQTDCGMCTQESLMTYDVGRPFTIAKLVHITPITIWFIIHITSVFMGFRYKLITGGAPHCIIHVELVNIPFVAGVNMSENISPLQKIFSCTKLSIQGLFSGQPAYLETLQQGASCLVSGS